LEEEDDSILFQRQSSFNFKTPQAHRKTVEQKHTKHAHLMCWETQNFSQPPAKINSQHEINVKEEGTNFFRVCPSFN
jgi:hypothetical protein